ncbi:MAG: hypothetical protein PVJ67_00030 [Candidatus Pacearchaeota archaeon]|jgi:hypothetical protein
MDYKEKEKPKRFPFNGMAIASNVPREWGYERVFDPMPKRVLTEEEKRESEEYDKLLFDRFCKALEYAAKNNKW